MNDLRNRPHRIRRKFAERLKAARLTAGYDTQKSFADALGIESETYRRYERSETEPGLETLAKISRLTEKSLDFLVLGPQSADADTS